MQFEIFNLTYREDPCEWLDIFSELPKLALLDSCHFGGIAGRYHIITGAPQQWLTLQDSILTLQDDNKTTSVDAISAEACWAEISKLGSDEKIDCELPFCGGLLGFIGYEFGAWSNIGVKPTGDVDFPDFALGNYRWSLVQDNHNRTAKLVLLSDCTPSLREKVVLLSVSSTTTRVNIKRKINKLESELNLKSYSEAIERIQSYIAAGDCYQVNFTHRFSNLSSSTTPLNLYRRLRLTQPGPMAAYLEIASKKALLCLSPERLVKNDRGFTLAQPIKGTSSRSKDKAEDRALAEQLINSEKNRAENLMIVDLLRNDLGRVCKPGSIKVPKLFALESFENVHHLVSSVQGELKVGTSNVELLRACFPGGSITGAPKRRAMEIIEETESMGRSAYCGSIFYSSQNGQFDSNITIRTIVATNSELYCWGGGGITHDSDPLSEHQESITKVANLIGL